MKKLKKNILLIALTAIIAIICCGCSAGSQANKEDATYTFYFLRHGETIFNVTNAVAGGWVDSPLTDHGIEVAKTLKDGFKDIDFSAAYTSISERAWDTVNFALDGKDMTPVINEDLKEMYFGTLEGVTGDAVAQIWADPVKRLTEGWKAEGGEDFQMASERMERAVQKAIEEHPEGGNILLGTHGLSLMAYLQGHFGDSPVLQEFLAKSPVPDIPNCSVTIVTYHDGEFELQTVADTSYIKE